jgi:hypothetical protein
LGIEIEDEARDVWGGVGLPLPDAGRGARAKSEDGKATLEFSQSISIVTSNPVPTMSCVLPMPWYPRPVNKCMSSGCSMRQLQPSKAEAF